MIVVVLKKNQVYYINEINYLTHSIKQFSSITSQIKLY